MAAPTAASVILRLDPTVVNRIAAGEVIHRPSNALKEMLENSLDAHSTNISVAVAQGGLKMLQIVDNGSGIRPADFSLICERFATSKLAAFSDLLSISTYGFRGEAMASISHVAKVTVTSMVARAQCAYRAQFAAGRMVVEPKACAGVKGTMICVEDMFHDMPARRAAVKNPSEEYVRCCEVVQRYAIHHAHRGVAFTCKKAGDARSDVHIQARTSVVDAIAAVFGSSLKKELLLLECEQGDWPAAGAAAAPHACVAATACASESDVACAGAGASVPIDIDTAAAAEASSSALAASASAATDSCDGDGPRFRVRAYVSNANYNSKKAVNVTFINSRLVECPPLRKAMDAVYAEVLPKHTHAFAYVAIELPPQHLDVNVHPTKREVHFLHQDALLQAMLAQLQRVLAGANASRAFYTQTTLELPPLTDAGPERLSAASACHRFAGAAAASTGGSGRGDRGGGGESEGGTVMSLAGAAGALMRQRGEGGSDESSGRSTYAAAGPVAIPSGAGMSKMRPPTALGHGAVPPTSALAGEDAAEGAAGSSCSSAPAGSSGRRLVGQSAAAAASWRGAPSKTVRVDSRQGSIAQFMMAAQPPGAASATASSSMAGSGGSLRPSSSGGDGDEDDSVEDEDNGDGPSSSSLSGQKRAHSSAADAADAASSSVAPKRRRKPRAAASNARPEAQQLTSVQELRAAVAAEAHEGIAAILQRHVFVGVVDRALSLVQHNTRLLLVNHAQLGREFFYQRALERFGGGAPAVPLSPPVSVRQALLLALLPRRRGGGSVSNGAGSGSAASISDADAEFSPEEEAFAVEAAAFLLSRAPMLTEYFSLSFAAAVAAPAIEDGSASGGGGGSDSGMLMEEEGAAAAAAEEADAAEVLLTHMPRLCDGHVPLLEHLPEFLLRLRCDVNWREEKPCFHGVMQALAALYAELPPPVPPAVTDATAAGAAAAIATAATAGEGSCAAAVAEDFSSAASIHHIVGAVLFPAFRRLAPARKLARDHHVVQLACTEQLYRIFERC